LTQAIASRTGVAVRFVLGSSGQLAAQIRNGAPYDLFLSANAAYVRDLETSGHVVAGSGVPYATGRLGLWSKSGAVKRVEDLAGAGVVHAAIANPGHAPYGLAARQLLERTGLWKRIEPKIVYGENVRQALQFAERGNADAAIVSWTLVFNRNGIRLSEELHDPIRQAGGVVARSGRKAEARKILDWLRSTGGQKVLAGFGLFPPVKDR